MIAAPLDRRLGALATTLDARFGAERAPAVAPLLARLLAGDPLDRDQRGMIVGEVLRLWAIEERLERRLDRALTAGRTPSR